MKNINEFIIIGRQTRDITDNEFKYLSTGTAVLNLSIAVNSSRKVGEQWQDEANFFDVTVWGKTAENLSRFINKGKLVAVRGHLQQQRWENAQTGQKRSKVALVADEVELLSYDNAGANNDGYASQHQPPEWNGNYVQPQGAQYEQQRVNAAIAPQYPQSNGQQVPPQAEAIRHAFKGQVMQSQPGGVNPMDPLDPPF